jgi:hypothetical protein
MVGLPLTPLRANRAVTSRDSPLRDPKYRYSAISICDLDVSRISKLGTRAIRNCSLVLREVGRQTILLLNSPYKVLLDNFGLCLIAPKFHVY